jgi:uncharacterized integral membrane protein
MNFRKIIIITILVSFAILVLQNTQVVELRLLFWKISMSQILYSVILLIFGLILGLLLRKKKRKKYVE